LNQKEDISDTDLVHHVRNGEKGAYQILFERYAPKIYSFAFSYLKNKADAEELVQDVFLKIWEKRETLDVSRNIKSFIFKIAVNTIYDFIRHKNIESVFKDFARENYEFHSNNTWDTVVFKEMQATLNQLVVKMPEQRKKIFQLSKIKGFTNDEIANKLGISKRTVENQLYRAVLYLKEHLKDESQYLILFFYLFYS
jgi:RNA polymerase sigma-70 factor (ECF subfamily)